MSKKFNGVLRLTANVNKVNVTFAGETIDDKFATELILDNHPKVRAKFDELSRFLEDYVEKEVL